MLRRGSDLVARLEGGRFVGFSTGMTHEQAVRHAETLAAVGLLSVFCMLAGASVRLARAFNPAD